MLNTILLGAAAMAATALAQGSAIVINQCSYEVYVGNYPAANEGYQNIFQTLSPSGGQYSQVWTQLDGGDGWSIKLSKEANSFQSNIMQYEYTWEGSGLIWFDLSDVNGNPWDGNWEITADNGCSPRQAAYRYSTDDAYGEQSCDGSASITVTLCSGDGMGGAGGSSSSAPPLSVSYSAPVATSSLIPSVATSVSAVSTPDVFSATSSSTPVFLSEIPQSSGGYALGFENDKVAGGEAASSPTTLATVNRGGVTVTEVATQVVTNVVTATAHGHARRHTHHTHHHP